MEFTLLLTILGLLATASHSSPTVVVPEANTAPGTGIPEVQMAGPSDDDEMNVASVEMTYVERSDEDTAAPDDCELDINSLPNEEIQRLKEEPLYINKTADGKGWEFVHWFFKEAERKIILKNGEVGGITLAVFEKCEMTLETFYQSFHLDGKVVEKTYTDVYESELALSLDSLFLGEDHFGALLDTLPHGEPRPLIPPNVFAFPAQRQVVDSLVWQWSSIYYGRWFQNGEDIRQLAGEDDAEYTMHTGVNGNYGNMLYESMWPKQIWRLIVRKKGVDDISCLGFMLHNTPIRPADMKNLCTEKCKDIHWPEPSIELSQGHIECCSYADMEKTLEDLPDVDCKNIIQGKELSQK